MKIWQKLLVAAGLLIVIEFTIATGSIRAAGQNCCVDGYNYFSGGCVNYDPAKKITTDAYQCDKSAEKCVDKGGGKYICETAMCCPGSSTLLPICLDKNGKQVPPIPCATSAPTVAPGAAGVPYDPCKNAAGTAKKACDDCKSYGTWTAIGCLENEPAALVGHLIGIGGGIAGGIAFLLMLWGAAQLVLSQGVPEKIQGAKDTITSAVIGLVFIFLSVLILKLIGVQILGIPGWS